jgi:hypothetical protein
MLAYELVGNVLWVLLATRLSGRRIRRVFEHSVGGMRGAVVREVLTSVGCVLAGARRERATTNGGLTLGGILIVKLRTVGKGLHSVWGPPLVSRG